MSIEQSPVQSSGTVIEPTLALPPEQLREMVSTGTRLFRDGRYHDAASLFLDVATADPTNADAWLACGIARFATGDYAASAIALRRGIRAFPQVVDSGMDLRNTYGNSADFDRHWDQLARRLEDEPADTDAWLVLGFLYHFVGDREHAAEVFVYIREQVPEDADIAGIFLSARPLAQVASAVGQDAVPAGSAAPDAAATVMSAPPPATLFEGRVSRDHHVAPKELLTVDGIVVKVEDTDKKPMDADIEIRVGRSKRDYEDLPIGSVITVTGQSGQTHQIQLSAIDDHTETVSFRVSR